MKKVIKKPSDGGKLRTGECVFMVWGVPIALRQRFKRACAKTGMTMSACLRDFMEKYGG